VEVSHSRTKSGSISDRRDYRLCRELEAFTQLLQDLPTDTGMFVLIQHLDPNYKSMLSEILARTTQMPVYQVQAGMIQTKYMSFRPTRR